MLESWAEAFPNLHEGGVFPRHEAAEIGGLHLRGRHCRAYGLFVLGVAEAACEFHGCSGGEHEVCGGGEFGFGSREIAEGEMGFEAAEADDETLDVDEEGPVEALPDGLGGRVGRGGEGGHGRGGELLLGEVLDVEGAGEEEEVADEALLLLGDVLGGQGWGGEAEGGEFVAVGEEALGEDEGGGFVAAGLSRSRLDVGDVEVGVVVFYVGGAEGGFGGVYLGGLGFRGWESGEELVDLMVGGGEVWSV